MQFSLFAVVLAATTIASPTSQTWRDEKRGLEIRGLGDQGDGYYGVAFDANGVGTVKFTPWAQLNHTGEAAAAAEVEVAFNKTTGGIEKRGGYTTCTGEWANGGHLDIANIQLARNSDNGGDNGNFFFYNNWGWISFPPHAYVHHEGVTAYFCPDDSVYFGYNTVIWMTTEVSKNCGGNSALGWYRGEIYPDGKWYLSGAASVGRTYRGRNFCTGNFYG